MGVFVVIPQFFESMGWFVATKISLNVATYGWICYHSIILRISGLIVIIFHELANGWICCH